jgi:hypothetical protein
MTANCRGDNPARGETPLFERQGDGCMNCVDVYVNLVFRAFEGSEPEILHGIWMHVLREPSHEA